MRRPLLVIIALGLLTSTMVAEEAPFPKAMPESQGLNAKDLDAVADVVNGFVKEDRIVGAELLVIKNGRTVLHRPFGLKDKAGKIEMPANTIFCIRSMTKPIVGVAIQMLIDEGKIGIDDPVSKYIPAFDNDKSKTITVRQALMHRGGLKLSSLIGIGLKGVKNVRELVDIVGKNGPESTPGTRFNYSDDGADTITALIESVSKVPAEQFVQERILDPLGMKDTICVLSKDDRRVERVASAYAGGAGSWRPFWSQGQMPIFPYYLGSQGMYSTQVDYAKFLKMIADGGTWNGKQLLSKDAVARILTPHADRAEMMQGFIDGKATYGQMMMLYHDPAGKLRAFGHGGSDGTQAYAFPDKDLLVLYFTQSRGNMSFIDLENAMHGLIIEPEKRALANKPVDAKAVAPFLGLYWFESDQCPVSVEVRQGKLIAEFPSQSELELRPTSEPNKWGARLASNIFVEFQKEGDNQATGFTLHLPTGKQQLPRMKKEEGLPSVDDLMKLRAKSVGVDKLDRLGTIHIKRTIEQSTSKNKGTIEIWMDGQRCRIERTLTGQSEIRIIDGDKVWMKRDMQAAQALADIEAEQARLEHPAFAIVDWRPLFQSIEVFRRLEADKRSLILLRCMPKLAPPRTLLVDAETGMLVGDRHIEMVPGVGRIGRRVNYLEYTAVDGVQFPSRIAHIYRSPLLGRFDLTNESIETKAKAPANAFEFSIKK